MSWPSIEMLPDLRLEKARDEVEDRRLPRARRPDQGDGLASRHAQRNAVQRDDSRDIAETHPIEGDLAAGDLQRLRSGHIADCWLDVEHLKDAVRGGEALLQRGVEIGQALERLVGQQQRGDEREEGARGARIGDDLMAAIEDHDGDGGAAQAFHHRRGARPSPRGAVDQHEQAIEEAGGTPLLIGLHAVGLDQPRALEGLAQQGRELADLGLGIGRDPAHSPADADDRANRQRKDEERDQRQEPVLVEHDADQEHDGQRVLAHGAQHIGRGGRAASRHRW